jgi:hypothetical protein
MRLVFLDTGTVGMVTNPGSKPRNVQCRQWTRDLLAAGVRVFIPEICDYEVRRKLIHRGATSGIARLDRLKIGFEYVPITTDMMLLAASMADLEHPPRDLTSHACRRAGPGRCAGTGGRSDRPGSGALAQ